MIIFHFYLVTLVLIYWDTWSDFHYRALEELLLFGLSLIFDNDLSVFCLENFWWVDRTLQGLLVCLGFVCKPLFMALLLTNLLSNTILILFFVNFRRLCGTYRHFFLFSDLDRFQIELNLHLLILFDLWFGCFLDSLLVEGVLVSMELLNDKLVWCQVWVRIDQQGVLQHFQVLVLEIYGRVTLVHLSQCL